MGEVEEKPVNALVHLTKVGDQVVLQSPVRPAIVERSDREWQIWYPDPDQLTDHPDRVLRGGQPSYPKEPSELPLPEIGNLPVRVSEMAVLELATAIGLELVRSTLAAWLREERNEEGGDSVPEPPLPGPGQSYNELHREF